MSQAWGAVAVATGLDHVVASKHFDPIVREYLRAVRDAGLSDHAPVRAELGTTGD